jgi:hypothetical protein
MLQSILSKRHVKKALQLGSATVEKLSDNEVGWTAAGRRRGSVEVAAAIRAELNTDIDRELLARMRDLTHQRMIRRPGTADEEAPDYQSRADKVENFTQRASAGRDTSPSRTSVAWVVATLAILGFLTAMLIMGIAISV